MYILSQPTFIYTEVQIPRSYSSEERVKYLNYLGIYGWEVCNVHNTTYLLKKRNNHKTHHLIGNTGFMKPKQMLKKFKESSYSFKDFLDQHR